MPTAGENAIEVHRLVVGGAIIATDFNDELRIHIGPLRVDVYECLEHGATVPTCFGELVPRLLAQSQ